VRPSPCYTAPLSVTLRALSVNQEATFRSPLLSLTDTLAGTCARLLSQEGDLGELSELGVLFLLFEMGLELNIDRLTVTSQQLCARVHQPSPKEGHIG
jgi:hypothetical protein